MYILNINKSYGTNTPQILGRVADLPYMDFEFMFKDGTKAVDLTGCTVEFRGLTSTDNKIISTESVTPKDSKNGTINFKVPKNFYSAPGAFKRAYFAIKKNGRIDTTQDVIIHVLDSVDMDAQDAQDVIDAVDKIIADVEKQVKSETNRLIQQIKNDTASAIADSNKKLADLDKQINDFKTNTNSTISQINRELKEINSDILANVTKINELGEKLNKLEQDIENTSLVTILELYKSSNYAKYGYHYDTVPVKYKKGDVWLFTSDTEFDGMNLIRYTDFEKYNTDRWNLGGGASTSKLQSFKHPFSEKMLLRLDNRHPGGNTENYSQIMGAYDKYINLGVNEDFTLVVSGFNNSNISDIDLHILGRKYGSPSEFEKDFCVVCRGKFPTSSVGILGGHFNSSVYGEGYFRFDNNGQVDDSKNSELYIVDPILIRGKHNINDVIYRPHPLDISPTGLFVATKDSDEFNFDDFTPYDNRYDRQYNKSINKIKYGIEYMKPPVDGYITSEIWKPSIEDNDFGLNLLLNTIKPVSGKLPTFNGAKPAARGNLTTSNNVITITGLEGQELFYRFNDPSERGLFGLVAGMTYYLTVFVDSTAPHVFMRNQYSEGGSWLNTPEVELKKGEMNIIPFTVPDGASSYFVSLQAKEGTGSNINTKSYKMVFRNPCISTEQQLYQPHPYDLSEGNYLKATKPSSKMNVNDWIKINTLDDVSMDYIKSELDNLKKIVTALGGS